MTDDRPGPPGDERADGDGPDDRDVPELDPDREAAVRGLLGDARETGPPPPEVAARLDDALAALGRGEEPEGTPAGPAAPVVHLRRRRVRRALLAAGAVAAAVAIAVPVTRSVTGPGVESASTPTVQEDGAGEAAPEAGDQSAPEALKPRGDRQPLLDDAQPAPGAQPSPGSGSARSEAQAPTGGEVLLSRTDFDDQVTALVRAGGLGPVPAARCGAPGPGRRIAVLYEGGLGTLRLVPDGDVVRAELYLCGRGGVARATAVRVR